MPEDDARLARVGTVLGRLKGQKGKVIAAFLGVYLSALGIALALGSSVHILVAVAVMPALVALSVSDLDRLEIPDWTSIWVAFVGAVVLGLSGDFLGLGISVACAVALWAGLAYVTGVIFHARGGQEVLGLGDIKLMAASVLLVGIDRLWAVVFLASVGGIIVSLLSRRTAPTENREVPFGPMLAFAAFLVLLGA